MDTVHLKKDCNINSGSMPKAGLVICLSRKGNLCVLACFHEDVALPQEMLIVIANVQETFVKEEVV